MTTFAQNQWYVAAYGSEISGELFTRTICGEPILFWRTKSGQVTGLAERCVHRRFPLSQAPTQLVDDQVICGYHGFTYGADGRCVSVPGQARVPRTARLKPYPVVEADSYVWVWIGDPDRADVTRVPRATYLDSPEYTTISGMLPLAARASLLIDNLLDLSHETYLHNGSIGTPEVAETPINTEVDEDAGIVYVSRRMDNAACPPFYSESTGLTGRIHRWQDIEFTPPCLYKLHIRIAPAGSAPNPDGTDPDGFHVEVVYGVTPETEHTTHNFWAVARDFALDDQGVSDFMSASNQMVIGQDIVALEALEKVIASEPDGYQELSINIDTGGLAARRLIKAMLAEALPQTAPR